MCLLSHFSCVHLFATLWTVAHQAPLSMGFSRHEYWSGLPCCPPEDLPNPGIEPVSLSSPALAERIFTTSATREAQYCSPDCINWFLATSLPLWLVPSWAQYSLGPCTFIFLFEVYCVLCVYICIPFGGCNCHVRPQGLLDTGTLDGDF